MSFSVDDDMSNLTDRYKKFYDYPDMSNLTDRYKKFYDYPDNISELTDDDTSEIDIIKSIIKNPEEYVELDCFELEQFLEINEETNGLEISSGSEPPYKKQKGEVFNILIKLLEEGVHFFI